MADADFIKPIEYPTTMTPLWRVRDLEQHVKKLEDAIRNHRSQKADDRCIEDDDRLYEALGDGIKCDRRVGDQCAMLENCRRFIQNRTEGGGWPTYAELEKALDVSIDDCNAADEQLAMAFEQWGMACCSLADEFYKSSKGSEHPVIWLACAIRLYALVRQISAGQC